MNKTLILVLLIVFFAFLLTGCTQIDISIGIDENYTAYVAYRVEMHVGELDARYQSILQNALHRIAWHYQEELGFGVEIDFVSDPSVLMMTRRVASSSFEQAFETLRGLLTDEAMTPFMMVDMAAEAAERQNRYSVVAMADVPHILRLSNAQELPPRLYDSFLEAAQSGGGTISLTLPASEVVKASHDVRLQHNQATLSVPLSFSEQTNLELTALINMLRDGEPGGSLEEILRAQSNTRNLAFLATAAALLVLLTALVIRLIARR